MRLGLLCGSCLDLNAEYEGPPHKEVIMSRLINAGKVGKYLTYLTVEDELEGFSNFFTKVTGKTLWSIQRSWARRMISNESFALIAPTGVGKTTLLLTYALYRAINDGRVLYIVPTRELMNQVYKALSSYNKFDVRVVNSDSIKDADLKDRFIAVLTHNFIHRNKSLINGLRFNLVAVDDFDALLKSSSIVDLILNTIGINNDAIQHARKVVELKNELAFIRYLNNEGLLSKLRDELYQHTLNLVRLVNYGDIGQLLIASATGRGRGERVKILRELLGFEVGSITDYLRNLVEVYEYQSEDRLRKLLNDLIGGTLIFVSKDLGLKYARDLTNLLSDSGFKVVLANSRKALDLLREGKVDVVVGVATYYGVLTRGIDEPLRIYNTVFVGIPKNEFNIENALLNPRTFAVTLSEVTRLGLKIEGSDDLIRRLRNLPPKKTKLLSYALRNLIDVDGPLLEIKNSITKALPLIITFIGNYVRDHGKLVINDMVIKRREGRLVIQSPDVMTYIQASGRSSRLHNGVMTLGLSVIFVEDEDLMRIFIRKLRNYVPNLDIRHLREVDLEEVKRRQVESRHSTTASSLSSNVRSALLIVESPTKAKTIASMFGRPGRRYLGEYVVYETVIPVDDKVYVTSVASTFGHVTDLAVDDGLHGIKFSGDGLIPVYTSIKRCLDCKNQFTEEVDECPKCGSVRIRDSRKIIDVLRKLVQEVDVVFVATDPDDEGEKIAYDIYLALRAYTSNIHRIKFHEVTRRALIDAIRNPEKVDLARVSAQIVRRVDDRLIGFELSNVLKRHFNKPWLGGGRVQSPVLNWVVRSYASYMSNRGYVLFVRLFDRYVITVFTKDRDEAHDLMKLINEHGIKLTKVSEEVRVLHPKPPFTTDELISEASRILKLSATAVMRLAQDLFELGYITYHRTDSTHVSANGIEVAREYLAKRGFGGLFKPRVWGDKGAHECIRPTKPLDANELYNQISNDYYVNITGAHIKMYDIIFRRFIASQLPEAKVKFHVYEAAISNHTKLIEMPVEVLDSGFMVLDSGLIQIPQVDLSRGELLVKPSEVRVIRGSNAKLLNVSDVIRLMKEKGIGRPSTYAKAIDNNVKHGYIIISKRQLYLIPTKLGISVCGILLKYFPSVTSEQLTADVEKLLDAVRANVMSRDEALTLLLSDVIDLRLRSNYLFNDGLTSEGLVI